MPAIGGPVTGKDFFNREKEVEEILTSLERDNVLLIAPRRYGKTSLMRGVESILCEKSHTCLFLDVMYIDKPEEFIIELADASFTEAGVSKREKILGILKEAFARIEEVDASIMGSGVRIKFRDALKEGINEDTWTKKGEDVLRAIIGANDNKPVYILMDELSECVNNMVNRRSEGARKFLQWFRSKRHQMIGGLMFLVGGSVSFDRVVKRINGKGLSWINDFRRVHIEGFSRNTALKFIEKCLTDEGIQYSEEIGDKILECLGEPYVPYFISVFLNILMQNAENGLNVEYVEREYSDGLLGVYGKGYFEYYRQRLRTYPEGLAEAAEEILKEACLVDEGYPTDLAFNIFREKSGIDDYETFRDLIFDLENDFYIKANDKEVRFRSKVLRDWWRLYYG